jgi:hypothetical protein
VGLGHPARGPGPILMNGSLFAPSRLVVYSGVETLSTKAACAPIVRWLGKPAAAPLWSCSRRAKRGEIPPGRRGRGGTKVFWELFEERKEEWVRSWFRKAACAWTRTRGGIVELVEGNTEGLPAECSRLAAFVGPRGPSRGASSRPGSPQPQRGRLQPLRPMAEGRYADALESLEKCSIRARRTLRHLGGLHGASAAGGLPRQRRAWHGRREAMLRAGIRKIKWKIYRQAARTFSPAACREVLSRITDADSLLRSSGAVSPGWPSKRSSARRCAQADGASWPSTR